MDRTHKLPGFSCGETRIDNYLKNNAWKDHKNYKLRIFCATAPGTPEVIGYYSMTFVVWVPDQGVSAEMIEKFDSTRDLIPAIYLAKLGVLESVGGQGVGTQLMADAFKRSLAISEHAGISTLTLDAIDQEKAEWYERRNLKRFSPGDLRMAISLATLRKALKAGA